MSQTLPAVQSLELQVQNIGGITETTVEISPGTTILTGRNATNRTSLLKALMAALGSERTPLKADADEGHVELTIGDETYTRTIYRRNGTLVTDGDPYLDDPTLADLFAFLLESNEARRAVTRKDNLRDIIMRPIDTDDIESQISALQNERDQIESQIDNIESYKKKLPKLEQKKSDYESKMANKKEELASIEEKIDKKGGEIEDKIEENNKLDDKLDELRDVRGDLERIRDQISAEEASIDALHEEQESIESDLAELQEVPDEELSELKSEMTRLRSRRTEIDESVDQLQTVIQFNQSLLEDDLDLFADLNDPDDSDTGREVTDELLAGEQLTCWTCGSDITMGQVQAMVNRFQEIHTEYMSERSDLDEQLDSLQTELSELEKKQRKREQLQSRQTQITSELADCKADLDQLNEQRDDLVATVDSLESEVEDLRSTDDQSELIDLHTDANTLEVEINKHRSELENVISEIDQLEEEIAQLDQLEDQRDEIKADIEDLRTKIDRLEQAAVDEFNTHMEILLDVLEYENLERIWLERSEHEERDGRRKVSKTHFEMHVVRSTPDGSVLEDDISNLSESEREVTGLVFALAGYLAHDLHEDLPVMLIDSIEAIDPIRIATLIDHFTEYPDYLLMALLKDDAETLDEGYQRITDI